MQIYPFPMCCGAFVITNFMGEVTEESYKSFVKSSVDPIVKGPNAPGMLCAILPEEGYFSDKYVVKYDKMLRDDGYSVVSDFLNKRNGHKLRFYMKLVNQPAEPVRIPIGE